LSKTASKPDKIYFRSGIFATIYSSGKSSTSSSGSIFKLTGIFDYPSSFSLSLFSGNILPGNNKEMVNLRRALAPYRASFLFSSLSIKTYLAILINLFLSYLSL
jgi:hypothetical protein